MRAINYSAETIHRTWAIDRTLENFNYEKNIHAFPSEEVVIPIEKKWTLKDVFLLHYVSEKS